MTSWPGVDGERGGDGRVDAAGHARRAASRSRRPPSGPAGRARRRRAARRAARRRRPRWSCGRARSAATPRACSSSWPIATSTCDGRATPAEQAEPVETSTPAASSSSSSESPSQPGKEKCALPGSRSAGVAVVARASGTAASTRRDEVVAQRRAAAPRSRAGGRPRGVVAAASPASAGVSKVPERTSRSCPPPCSSGVQATSRPSSSAPAPSGPPSLWPVRVSASTPLAAKSTGQLTDGLHGVGVQRHARPRGRASASAATGCTVPTSLLAHITVTSATSSPSAACEHLGVHAAERVDLEPGDLRRPRGRPATRRRRGRRGARRAEASTRVRRGSAARRAQNSPLTARLSLSVPPPVKTHLGRPGAQRGGDRLARLLDGAAGPPAGGVQRGGVAAATPCASVTAATRLREHRASRPHGRGRPRGEPSRRAPAATGAARRGPGATARGRPAGRRPRRRRPGVGSSPAAARTSRATADGDVAWRRRPAAATTCTSSSVGARRGALRPTTTRQSATSARPTSAPATPRRSTARGPSRSASVGHERRGAQARRRAGRCGRRRGRPSRRRASARSPVRQRSSALPRRPSWVRTSSPAAARSAARPSRGRPAARARGRGRCAGPRCRPRGTPPTAAGARPGRARASTVGLRSAGPAAAPPRRRRALVGGRADEQQHAHGARAGRRPRRGRRAAARPSPAGSARTVAGSSRSAAATSSASSPGNSAGAPAPRAAELQRLQGRGRAPAAAPPTRTSARVSPSTCHSRAPARATTSRSLRVLATGKRRPRPGPDERGRAGVGLDDRAVGAGRTSRLQQGLAQPRALGVQRPAGLARLQHQRRRAGRVAVGADVALPDRAAARPAPSRWRGPAAVVPERGERLPPERRERADRVDHLGPQRAASRPAAASRVRRVPGAMRRA